MRGTRAIRPVPIAASARRRACLPPTPAERRGPSDGILVLGMDSLALRRQFPLVSALMMELATPSLAARVLRR